MDYCAECTYLDPEKCKGSCNGLFYCEKRYDYVLGNTEKCGDFCRAYSRSYYRINDIQFKGEQEERNNGTNCYITTIVSDILGYPEDGIVLKRFRQFRDNYLQKHDEYKDLLVEYDVIGPLISKSLSKDPYKEIIAQKIYKKSLKNILSYLTIGKYEDAVNMYKDMAYTLKRVYGYDKIDIEPFITEYCDIEKSGHGKIKLKEVKYVRMV